MRVSYWVYTRPISVVFLVILSEELRRLKSYALRSQSERYGYAVSGAGFGRLRRRRFYRRMMRGDPEQNTTGYGTWYVAVRK